MSVDTVPEFVTEGAFVTWDTWCGQATVKVMVADTYRISYMAWDGVWDCWEATRWTSLAENLRHVRPATEEEISDWKRYNARFFSR